MSHLARPLHTEPHDIVMKNNIATEREYKVTNSEMGVMQAEQTISFCYLSSEMSDKIVDTSCKWWNLILFNRQEVI